MNKRIEELILDAGFPKFDKMYVVTDGEELEKFAELIVRECANILESQDVDPSFKLRMASAIKQHFGVET